MSLNVDYHIYNENVDKQKVYKELAHMVKCANPETSCGLAQIIWYDDAPLESKEAAEKFIDEHDEYYDGCLAVRYKELPDNAPKTPKYTMLLERRKKAEARYKALNDEPYISTVKAAYISCRYCASKFNRLQMLSQTYSGPNNLCPICKNDLRPQTKLNAIQNAKQRLDNINEQLQAERDRLAQDHGVVKWLVKIEFDT